jgi:hypothetical protein
MTALTRVSALTCLALAMTATTAHASPAFKPGLYTCYSYVGASIAGGLKYHGSMVLKPAGAYDFAYNVKGRTLVKPKSGKCRTSGSRLTFTSGILALFYAVRKDAAKFVMHVKQNDKLFTWCYLK